MYIPTKFAAHAALLLARTTPAELPEQPHLPEEPMGGSPRSRGLAAFGTDSRRWNGTGTAIWGTNTYYFWPARG
jgi:hypothetical protein